MPGDLSVASSRLMKQVVFLCSFSVKQGKDLRLHAMPEIINIIRKFLKSSVIRTLKRKVGQHSIAMMVLPTLRVLAFILENRKNRSIDVTARASTNEW